MSRRIVALWSSGERGGRIVAGERVAEMRMPFEVDGQQIAVGFGFAEQPHQGGLAHLSCAAQHERLAPGAMQPLLHVPQPMTVYDSMFSVLYL